MALLKQTASLHLPPASLPSVPHHWRAVPATDHTDILVVIVYPFISPSLFDPLPSIYCSTYIELMLTEFEKEELDKLTAAGEKQALLEEQRDQARAREFELAREKNRCEAVRNLLTG
jgi:hypothetical protein